MKWRRCAAQCKEHTHEDQQAACRLFDRRAGARIHGCRAEHFDRPGARHCRSDGEDEFKGTWRSSKLIGLDIYNRADEKIGDINEILLDKDGKVKAVVIGVGGFLGMGEHDVAVSMDKLKFMEEAHKSARADAKTDGNTGHDRIGRAPAGRDTANDWVPDHAVMDATKDQLKALPQFKYSSYN